MKGCLSIDGKQNRRLNEENKRLKLKMEADAKDQEQWMANMVTA